MAVVNASGAKVEEKVFNIKYAIGSAMEQKIEEYANRNDMKGTEFLRAAVSDLFLLDEIVDGRVADFCGERGMNREAFLRAAVEAMLATVTPTE